MTAEPCRDCPPRPRLGTPTLVALCVLGVFAASTLVDLARAAGGWRGGVLWFLGAVGLGWGCGWLAGRIVGDP